MKLWLLVLVACFALVHSNPSKVTSAESTDDSHDQTTEPNYSSQSSSETSSNTSKDEDDRDDPSNKCGKNEIYSKCKITCPPQTCAGQNGTYHCPLQSPDTCKPGCNCKKGYVRNGTITDPCIPSGLCPTKVKPPTKKCGKNEVFSQCKKKCPPQICDTLFASYACFAPDDCRESGCNCAKGYLRNGTADDPCIPKSQCKPLNPENPNPKTECDANEEYNNCGTACEASCDNYNDKNRICTLQCVSGCFCKDGLIRDRDGNCVEPNKCPAPKCGANEILSKCWNPCQEKTCKTRYRPDDRVCAQNCKVGCRCADGYLRHDNGTCVQAYDCSPPRCNDDEDYDQCGTACEITCELGIRPCTKQCVDGCFCKNGLVRSADGSCIKQEQCHNATKCGKNEVFNKCRVICPPQTCASIYTLYKCISNQTCEPGCDCKPDYLRNGTDTDPCIPSKLCPPARPQCGNNEKYVEGEQVCQKTCENKDLQTKPCETYTGCVCEDGLVRDGNGECVPPENCEPVCGANEVATDCYSSCSKTCKTRFRDDRVCPAVCYKGCNCINGYLRHDNGTCVPEQQCSPPKCNDDEYFPECGPSCEDTCANFNNTCRICTRRCATGCFCKPGTVRGPDGITCVKKDSCPTPTCGPNEHYEACPPNCPPQTCRAMVTRYDCTKFRKCCQPQCRCDADYTRNDDNVCIKSTECFKN